VPKPRARPEQLVAEADAEERDPRGERLTAAAPPVVGGGRVTGAVGQEDPVGARRPARRRASTWPAARAPACHAPPSAVRRHRLDAEVECGHGRSGAADVLDDVRLGRGDVARSGRRPPSAGCPARAGAARRWSCSTGRDPTRIAPRSRRCRVSARVSTPLMPTTPPSPQLGRPGCGWLATTTDPRGLTHDVAGHPDATGLRVLVVDPGVADVRGGLDHDLPVVRRVGERLLVAGHAGGEDGFAERSPPAP
jgi:hypothetical protein